MNYTLPKTERNKAKLKLEQFTYAEKQTNGKTQITKWRCTDRHREGTSKKIEDSFEFVLTNPHYHEAYPAKMDLVQIENEIGRRAV